MTFLKLAENVGTQVEYTHLYITKKKNSGTLKVNKMITCKGRSSVSFNADKAKFTALI